MKEDNTQLLINRIITFIAGPIHIYIKLIHQLKYHDTEESSQHLHLY